MYCESWRAAYQNLLPQVYLDSLTVENCMPEKVSTDDIVLEETGSVLGICHVSGARARKFYEKNGFQISGNEREIEIAGCGVREVEYIYHG